MARQALSERRKIGRPPAGARAGEKVKDYPQLSIRLPSEVKAKLQALSLITSRPQWRIISDAIECYFRGRPDQEPRLAEALTARARARSIGSARRDPYLTALSSFGSLRPDKRDSRETGAITPNRVKLKGWLHALVGPHKCGWARILK